MDSWISGAVANQPPPQGRPGVGKTRRLDLRIICRHHVGSVSGGESQPGYPLNRPTGKRSSQKIRLVRWVHSWSLHDPVKWVHDPFIPETALFGQMPDAVTVAAGSCLPLVSLCLPVSAVKCQML